MNPRSGKMHKVFQSCYALDQRCYTAYGLTEDILMEHAATGMAAYIQAHFEAGSTILIVSGTGNNGADGIVLARQLYGAYAVKLYLPFGVKSVMAKKQLARAEAVGVPMVDTPEDATIVVDAIFGAGLNRNLNEETCAVIARLNCFKGFKIACDIPTGVGEEGSLMPVAFRADVTLTMGAYTEAHYLDESKAYIGELLSIDLGVSREQYEVPCHTYVLEAGDLTLPSRTGLDSHKGTFGHAAVFCGEKEGAGIIAGMAANRFGAGLTTLVVHDKVSPPAWLMHATDLPKNSTAIAIGMGLGAHFEREFLQKNVVESHVPIVLDADAFYHSDLLAILEQKERDIVVTPHPKEFTLLWKKLTGEKLSVAEVQRKRFEMVRKFNALYPHVTLLLKGATMLIIQEERLYINPLGSPKLSKGGSGDVLSGLIVSLLAQGCSGIESALQASLAFTCAAEKYRGASYAMLPTDIIEALALLERA